MSVIGYLKTQVTCVKFSCVFSTICHFEQMVSKDVCISSNKIGSFVVRETTLVTLVIRQRGQCDYTGFLVTNVLMSRFWRDVTV